MRKLSLSLLLFAAAAAFAGTEQTTASRTSTVRSATPRFTLEQAILTALQRNPSVLNAEQEIRRSQGVILQIGAQALPQVVGQASLNWTDPNLSRTSFSSTDTTVVPSPT